MVRFWCNAMNYVSFIEKNISMLLTMYRFLISTSYLLTTLFRPRSCQFAALLQSQITRIYLFELKRSQTEIRANETSFENLLFRYMLPLLCWYLFSVIFVFFLLFFFCHIYSQEIKMQKFIVTKRMMQR